jgi:malate dehydrogenase (oxaloacetate-decarboxylating)
MALPPSASYSLTLRAAIKNRPGMVGRLTSAIDGAGGDIRAVDLVELVKDIIVRDFTINARDEQHGQAIVAAIRGVDGIRIVTVSDRTFLMHLGGEIEIHNKVPLKTRDDLSMAYTPGVARVCLAIREDPGRAFALTIKPNTVAIVTDGTTVLGLGDIGPQAALPVMERKSLLFKELAGVDLPGVPGHEGRGRDRADGQAHRARVRRDQPRGHLRPALLRGRGAATAGAGRAGLPRRPARHGGRGAGGAPQRLRIVRKELGDISVVVCGWEAAGTAPIRILRSVGVRRILGVDEHGILASGRPGPLDAMKTRVAQETNPEGRQGPLSDAVHGSDVFIGLSVPGVLRPEDVKAMARDPIIFAMANPVPEIMAEEVESLVRVMATGRSDYPNQINNVLCFPGFFRGLLDCRASRATDEMKIAAAQAIASVVTRKELHEEYIIASVFNKKVAAAVAREVVRAAQRGGIARRRRRLAR